MVKYHKKPRCRFEIVAMTCVSILSTLTGCGFEINTSDPVHETTIDILLANVYNCKVDEVDREKTSSLIRLKAGRSKHLSSCITFNRELSGAELLLTLSFKLEEWSMDANSGVRVDFVESMIGTYDANPIAVTFTSFSEIAAAKSDPSAISTLVLDIPKGARNLQVAIG